MFLSPVHPLRPVFIPGIPDVQSPPSTVLFASRVTICTVVRVNIASSGSNGDVDCGIKSKSVERDLIHLLPQYMLHEVLKGTLPLTCF